MSCGPRVGGWKCQICLLCVLCKTTGDHDKRRYAISRNILRQGGRTVSLTERASLFSFEIFHLPSSGKHTFR